MFPPDESGRARSTLSHFGIIGDIIAQPAVVGLTSGLHLKDAPLCQGAPPHPERTLTDACINTVMVFVRNNVQNFQSDARARG